MRTKLKPSVNLRIVRALSQYGEVDYSDGGIPCSWETFQDSIRDVSEKCDVVIVRMGAGRYVVTKVMQKKLQKIAGQNAHRDSLFITPHPRWKQLEDQKKEDKVLLYVGNGDHAELFEAIRRGLEFGINSPTYTPMPIKKKESSYDWIKFSLLCIGALLITLAFVTLYFTIYPTY